MPCESLSTLVNFYDCISGRLEKFVERLPELVDLFGILSHSGRRFIGNSITGKRVNEKY